MSLSTISSATWAETHPTGRMLRPSEVFERIGLSRSQVYVMIARGEFPPFLKLSARTSALPESWLDKFLKLKAADALGQSCTSSRN